LATAIMVCGCGQGSRSGGPGTDDGSTDTAIDTLLLPDGGIDPCGTVVHEGNVGITGEASVAALAGVTRIAGNLSIVDSSVSTLGGLSSLRCVDGLVHVENNKLLTGISGLSNLQKIQGALVIKHQDTQFADVTLPELEYVGGDMTLQGLLHWKSPSFPKLARIGLTLRIEDLSIDVLDGFPALTHVGGSLVIIGNGDLQGIPGLSALTYLGRDLEFHSNPRLENIEALAGLTEVNGHAILADNEKLSLVGLQNVTIVRDYLFLGNLDEALKNVDGLSGLIEVVGDGEAGLGIADCDELTNLDGLSNLNAISHGDLLLSDNPKLEQIDGLCNLTTIGWDLGISGNSSLRSLDGLDNVQALLGNKIKIFDNSSLPACEAWGFVEQMQALGWSGNTSSIYGNWDAGVCEDGSACDW
jgi:hypothetical protein